MINQPLVLLLSSILSASGIGCSAITAVVTDPRPANRENHGDTDRLAAIGRVFENQGRYDKAEVMYRKALKSRPQDSQILNQLQQLAARRQEQKFGPTGTANAIAMADIVSPPKTGAPQAHRTVNTVPNAATWTTLPQTSPAAVPAPGPQPQLQPQPQPQPQRTQPQRMRAAASVHRELSVVTTAARKPDAEPGVDLAFEKHRDPAGNDGWRSSQSLPVTSDAVLAALERPDDHVEMLLNALSNGDNFETKALAATLLGDCDPGNTRVRSALAQHQGFQSDPEVLIALCDSQIERNEADLQTANCLICLCTSFSGDTQIQAASQLKNFVGTEHESSCLTALNELLVSEVPSVRATAALTLGDFTSIDDSTLGYLQDMARSDSSENVRNAATSTLSRQKPDTLQIIPAQGVPSE